MSMEKCGVTQEDRSAEEKQTTEAVNIKRAAEAKKAATTAGEDLASRMAEQAAEKSR